MIYKIREFTWIFRTKQRKAIKDTDATKSWNEKRCLRGGVSIKESFEDEGGQLPATTKQTVGPPVL